MLDTARRLRDTGELPTGRKITGRADFFLGSADNPIDPAPGWRPTGLQAKVDAGAQFVQTQFCMDAGVVRRYMARLAEHGMADKLSFLIGIVPLRSAKSARWIKEKLFGAIIPDALIDRMERAAIRRRKAAASASIGARIGGDSARCRRPHHGAG